MKRTVVILIMVALSTACSSLRFKSTEEVRGLGEEAYASENYGEAQTYYDELLRRDDEDVNARLKRARSRDKTGNILAAREDYSSALETQPEDARARLYRAELSIRKGDLGVAEADLRALSSSGELETYDRVIALKFLGNIQVRQNKYAGAISFYRQATSLGASASDPLTLKHVAESHYNLAQCLYVSKRFQESHDRFVLYARLAPAVGLALSPQDNYLMAVTAYLSGDFATANTYWPKADPQLRARASRVLEDPSINSKQFH
jgi:tetratricopeptide (TPR) repeat protein